MKELPKIFKKRVEISFLEKLNETIKRLNSHEKIIFFGFVVLLTFSTLLLLFKINEHITVEVPRAGGSITEGVIGSPRFINPLLAISDTDRDLVSLVYSGLMKATPEGELVVDIAEKLEVSPNGLRYIFFIKENAEFHDGMPITADDVLYTIGLAQNDVLKSPRRAAWEGIGVEKIDNSTVAFNLNQPYSPFLENTAIGILPKHIWGELETEQITFSDFNTNPIGSGPYKISSIRENSSGIPKSYTLKSYSHYTLGKPFISTIEIKFFNNETELVKAYDKGQIDSMHAVPPSIAKELQNDGERIITHPLPRVFGLFFNQNQATVFTNKEVRVALNEALDKEKIVKNVLNEFGTSIDGPFPPGILIKRERKEIKSDGFTNTERAIDILERNGWQRGPDGVMIKRTKKNVTRLSFGISTGNVPELKATANILKEEWGKIGAEVELKFFETGTLNQEVIRPRKYDSLLFGEIVGRDFDLFAFWHSSQRNDPGLNIALYTNIDADKMLETIRETSSKRERSDSFAGFEKEIDNDVPAVFLYSPDFIYATSKKIKGLKLGIVTTPSERFLNIHEWHIKVDRVWPIFVN